MIGAELLIVLIFFIYNVIFAAYHFIVHHSLTPVITSKIQLQKKVGIQSAQETCMDRHSKTLK